MSRTLELLAAVTLVKHGVERILDAFTDAAFDCGRKDRFWILVEGLKNHQNGDNPLAVSCIQLLNCLITNHEDFEQRCHLRSELYRTTDESGEIDFRQIVNEIEKLLPKEKPLENDVESNSTTPGGRPLSATNSNTVVNMTNQQKFINCFHVFHVSKDEDFDELANRFENIRFDFENIDDCYKILRNSVIDTPVEPLFLSFHQLLLFIRDEPYTRYFLFKFFFSFVSFISISEWPIFL